MPVRKFIRKNAIEIIYNYGPSISNILTKQVVRSTYSNLYYPEVNFWQGLSWIKTIQKKIIDNLRLKATLKADGIVFENEDMLNRAVSLFNYPIERTKYVKPSVSKFDESNTKQNLNYLKDIKGVKILYLSSYYKNKNIDILPSVAKSLKKSNFRFKFILSLDKDNSLVNINLYQKIIQNNVLDYFEFVGKVESIYVHQIVKLSDAMILLSNLECFSSNVIESLYFDKPLFISDKDWARVVCKNTGIYVNRDDAEDIANKIINYYENADLQKTLQLYRKQLLNEFNTPYTKVKEQVGFLKFIAQL